MPISVTRIPSRTPLAAGLLLGVLLASCSNNKKVLRSISVTPADPSVVAGANQTFTATGTHWNGDVQDLTTSVTWSSTNTAVATVDQGTAYGLLAGTTTITATDPRSGLGSTTELTVTPAVLSSLSLTPTLPQIALGTNVQITAMGIFSDNTVQNLTGSVVWSSSNATVALVSGGLAQSAGLGASTITATDAGSGIGYQQRRLAMQ